MNRPLSEDHPLRTDPNRPWPYQVFIEFREAGARKITARRIMYVQATSEAKARMSALREARAYPRYRNGKRLIASRPGSSRPLDKQDAIGRSLA